MKVGERELSPDEVLRFVIGKLQEEEARSRMYKVVAHSLLDELADGAARAVAESGREAKRRPDIDSLVNMEPVSGAIN